LHLGGRERNNRSSDRKVALLRIFETVQLMHNATRLLTGLLERDQCCHSYRN
jgi:hypothetical protein